MIIILPEKSSWEICPPKTAVLLQVFEKRTPTTVSVLFSIEPDMIKYLYFNKLGRFSL